ncbi:MAG: hypothetical protein H7A43_08160 [Verrucomicrobia bacterium]|nr:hypothetical protein [Kiritimatiellia bacterium]MCP5488608.1 hypothetical protein [Verrucomicrobiota bacterium]
MKYVHKYAHMRTTVELPDDIFRMAKRVTVERGCTFRELVTTALQHELSGHRGEKKVPRRELPAIYLPADAPILHMTPEELAAAEASAEAERFHALDR